MQLHDIHIALLPPPLAKSGDANYGPFWTTQVPEASLTGTPYTSQMALDLTDLPTSDSFIIFGPNEVPSKASMAITWMPGPQGLFPYNDPMPTYSISNPSGGYAGEYTLAGSHIDFSFTSQVSATDKTPFSFTTDPDGQRLLFAQVGHEVNGLFMH